MNAAAQENRKTQEVKSEYENSNYLLSNAWSIRFIYVSLCTGSGGCSEF